MKDEKYLIVGDVHTHQYMIDDVKKLDDTYNFNKIIFLGDYVDDWDASGLDSLNCLKKIIDLKKSNMNKYHMLLGNHELSYLGYPCAGHKYEYELSIGELLKDNIDIFDLYYKLIINDRNYYCSHAGIVDKFYMNHIFSNIDKDLENLNQNKLNIGDLLYMSDYHRGGLSEYSSLLWADKEELEWNNCSEISYQIVGHTPVETIKNTRTFGNDFWFTDTHSTYRNGLPIGDKSYLLIINDKFIIKKQEDLKG